MTPYFLLCSAIILYAFLDLTNLKNNRFIYWFLFLGLVFFIGTRDFIGTDFRMYEWIYRLPEKAPILEPGYMLLSSLTRALNGSFYLLSFIVAFLSLYIKFIAFKRYTPLFGVSVLYFLGYYLFPQEFNQIRQGLAAGILFFSLPYLQNGKTLMFFAIVGIATIFHTSSIIFCISYFIYKLRHINNWMIFLIVLFSSVFMFVDILDFLISIISNVILKIMPIPLAQEKLAGYIKSKYAVVAGFQIGSLYLYFFIFLFSRYKKRINSEFFNGVFALFWVGVCLSFFLNSFALLGRLMFHFIMLGGLLYSYVVFYEKRIGIKVLLVLILSIMSLTKVIKYVNRDDFREDYIPYRSFVLKSV